MSSGCDNWADARAVLGPSGLLSVIMPAYNLGGSIGENISRVATLLAGRVPFEIVAVDDASRDSTPSEIREAAARLREVKPVILESNLGKGGALARGFEASRGSHILLLDGDLDLDPSFLDRFFSTMRRESAAIVIGSKRHRDSEVDYPFLRRLSSWAYYTIVHALVGLPVTDTQTGMKLFTRDALRYSLERMLTKRFAFDVELLSIANERGYKVAEAPVRMHFGKKLGCLSWHNVKTVMTDTLAIFYRLRILRYYQHVVPCKMPSPPPLVSIVVACPAPSPYLSECLDGIAALSYPNVEAIILPDDPSPSFAWPQWARVVPTGRIRPAEKRNIGIDAARGEIVALLDDDASPLPDWLDHAVPYFSDPSIGAVGGPAVTPPSDPPLAHASGAVYASALVSGGCRYRYAPDRVRDVDDFPSCNLLVRTSTLRAMGGFRTDFWPGEDTILCSDIVNKMRQRIVYDPWSIVRHHRRPLFGPHLRQVGRYAMHRGYFAKKFPETSRRFSYFIPSLLLLGTLGTALCLPAVFIPVAPAASAAFRHAMGAAAILGLAGAAVLAIYALAVIMFSVTAGIRLWALTAAGTVATHYVYGARFLQGLLSRRMPCEVAKFDHPSEKQ